MNQERRPRTASFSEDHNWPRQKPVYSLLALLIALFSGAGIFAWQFKTVWTPLQQYYLPDYLRTAHLNSQRNSSAPCRFTSGTHDRVSECDPDGPR